MFDELVKELRSKYNPHTIFLYGSHARGDASPESDIDILVITKTGEATTDSRPWGDYNLDAWIYPEEEAEFVDDFLHLAEAKILWSKNKWGNKFLQAVRERFAEGPEALPEHDKQHRLRWFHKMLNRIQRDDTEAHFRRHWLLVDLLPTYFGLLQAWYMGPKRSLQWLEENKPNVYKAFQTILDPACPTEALVEQVQELLTPFE